MQDQLGLRPRRGGETAGRCQRQARGLRVSILLRLGPGLQVFGGACSATCQVTADGLGAFQSQRSRTVLPGGGQ